MKIRWWLDCDTLNHHYEYDGWRINGYCFILKLGIRYKKEDIYRCKYCGHKICLEAGFI